MNANGSPVIVEKGVTAPRGSKPLRFAYASAPGLAPRMTSMTRHITGTTWRVEPPAPTSLTPLSNSTYGAIRGTSSAAGYR
jgi:hypothetical protein